MKKYKPSNGTEGMWFTDKFCMNCINCDPDPNRKKQCQILCASLCYSVNDPRYPKEWIYDKNDKPCCTAWVKWDWNNDGNPDDPDNPKVPIPDDPQQLCLPFIIEEINFNTNETANTPIHIEEKQLFHWSNDIF